jgi:hypothetical protein
LAPSCTTTYLAFFFVGPVQGSFLQHLLLGHIMTHLTPTPPHNLLHLCPLYIHHTTWHNNQETHKFYM